MASVPNQIAEAVIRLDVVGQETVRRETQAATQSVREMGTSMEATGAQVERTGGRFDKLATSLAMGGLAMNAVIDTARIGIEVGKVIGNYLFNINEEYDRFDKAISNSSASSRLKALQDEIESVANRETEGVYGQGLLSLLGINAFGGVDEARVADLQGRITMARRVITAESERASQDALRKSIDDSKKRAEAARVASLEGEERIEAERLNAIAAIDARIAASKDKDLTAQLNKEKEALNALYDKRVDDLRAVEAERQRIDAERQEKEAKQIAEKTAREIEAAERVARSAAEATAREIARVLERERSEQASLLRGQAFSGMFDTTELIQAVREVTTAVRSRL